MPVPPSGEQVEIVHGDQRAVVVAVGGGLRCYEAGGAPVLDGYDVGARADGARGQLLVPWPNRVRDGTWTWRGQELQLALTEPDQHNAIHGLLRWVGWRPVERADDGVTMEADVHPQPGYPWSLTVRAAYRLAPDGLTVVTTIVNRGSDPAPVAAGAHPYLTVGTDRIDEAVLHLPAATYLPTGDQQIPTGQEPVEGTPYDFRTPRALGDTEIDYAFTDLERGADGTFTLTLGTRDGSRRVELWLGAEFPYVEVFTGDALPDVDRRRRGLGVEPMTAPPNALADGRDLVVLDPEEAWSGSWGIRVR